MRPTIKVLRGSDQIVKIPFCSYANLDGYKAWAQLRTSPFSEEILDELTTENKRIVICRDHFDLSFPHDVTQKWKFRKAVFDVKAISPNGGEVRMADGRIVVIPEVTR